MGGGAGLVDPVKPVVPRVGDRGKQRPARKFPDPERERGDDDDEAPEPPRGENAEPEPPAPADDEAGHQVDIVVRGPLPTGANLAQPPRLAAPA